MSKASLEANFNSQDQSESYLQKLKECKTIITEFAIADSFRKMLLNFNGPF